MDSTPTMTMTEFKRRVKADPPPIAQQQKRHLKQLLRVRQLQCMDLDLNEIGEDMLRRATANLYCTARREGTEDRAKKLLELME